MLLQLNNITLTLGGREILSHLNLSVKEHEKIALVGPNGAGKTTLLKVIAGELYPDRDDKRQSMPVYSSRNIKVSYLSQTPFKDLSLTAEEEMLKGFTEKNGDADPFSRERFEYETKFDRLLAGMGFSDVDKSKKISEFSGGQQTRLALIRYLLMEPDLLLLDEPTNHLDMKGTEWLEDYLCEYSGAVIVVSHDRFFLDRVAEKTAELEDGQITMYTGGYTEYRKAKGEAQIRQQKAYERYIEEKERLEGLNERFKHKPTKASFARAKLKQLERMPKVEPVKNMVSLDISQLEQPEYLGPKWIYEAEHIKIGYDKTLYETSLRIRKGQKIGVIGENGSGKTTLLKTIAGLIPQLAGKSTLGNKVLLGYYDQKTGDISSEKTVLEHFHDLYPAMNLTDVRKKLGMWLFRGQDVGKTVSSLSGGEKSRLVLAELMQGKPNFLVLDEPTNHMDIPAKETLEKILSTYTGTQLLVSHDRYFMAHTADSLIILENGEITYYPFGYEHYLEKRSRQRTGEFIAGQMSAEDAALLQTVQNVPKKSHIQSRELTTEESYIDWCMGLADEQLELAFEGYEKEMLKFTSIDDWNKAEDRLLEACLQWFDKYNELHD